jgi:DNA-directed RNA polymerase subunit RPC12/RpoP
MAKIKFPCPSCQRLLQCDQKHRGQKVKCPHCKERVLVPKKNVPPPPASVQSEAVQSEAVKSVAVKRRRPRRKILLAALALVLLAVLAEAAMWFVQPTILHWPDRRPIGVLFLASNFHASATNPRGWFNDPSLDVTGPDGPQHFRDALWKYTDQSLDILKRTGAQGVIVWDLEGEEYPPKTTFIGDPRLVGRLAPEMAAVVAEFFARLRNAGLKVGVTVRPQQLVFDNPAQPRQAQVLNLKRMLLDKIDYARTNWGATLFYVDSNGGVRRPDELWQLRSLAAQRPDILLIPEHVYPPYAAFSAHYVSMRKDDPAAAAKWTRKLFPKSFQAVDISDSAADWAKIAVARSEGDILLFRAWIWSPECELLAKFAQEPK